MMYYNYYNKEGDSVNQSEWNELWKDFEYRKIGHDQNDNFFVSTVWIGMVYSTESENPLTFETMVFNKKDGEIDYRDIDVDRYSTLEEAKKGHKAMCKKYLS